MPRRKAAFAKGERYHIFNRSNNSIKIFLHPEDFHYFLKLVRTFISSGATRIHSFTLLPNHFHFSLSLLDTIDVSSAMRELQAKYARFFNKKYRRRNHVFGTRFKAVLIESTEYFDYLSRYIHRNAVEANLVKNPEDWQYSSSRAYLAHTPNADDPFGFEICSSETLSRFHSVESYRSFVDSDWERNPWQLVNGIWVPTRG
jgi:REP element-mobilizing transposase RayT